MTGDDLKAWRERLGLSTRDAAAALKLSYQGFRNMLYGNKPISQRTEHMATLVEQQRHTQEKTS